MEHKAGLQDFSKGYRVRSRATRNRCDAVSKRPLQQKSSAGPAAPKDGRLTAGAACFGLGLGLGL
eukprot:6054330-Prymnesium_polylepis.1